MSCDPFPSAPPQTQRAIFTALRFPVTQAGVLPVSRPAWMASWQARQTTSVFRWLRMIPNTVSALRISRTSLFAGSSHLAPFAVWSAFPTADYYGASVAVGLAPPRRSRGTSLSSVRARGRCPTHPLEWPHWPSPAVRKVRRFTVQAAAHRSTGDQTLFRQEGTCSERRLGFRQSSFHRGARVLRRDGLQRLGLSTAFLTCSCPLCLSTPGKCGDPRTSFRVLPACSRLTTTRLAAHSVRAAFTAHGSQASPSWTIY